jgi:hypothetical protein
MHTPHIAARIQKGTTPAHQESFDKPKTTQALIRTKKMFEIASRMTTGVACRGSAKFIAWETI